MIVRPRTLTIRWTDLLLHSCLIQRLSIFQHATSSRVASQAYVGDSPRHEEVCSGMRDALQHVTSSTHQIKQRTEANVTNTNRKSRQSIGLTCRQKSS